MMNWRSIQVRGLAVVAVALLVGCGDSADTADDAAADSAALAPVPETPPPATMIEPDSLTKSAWVRSMVGQEIELESVPVSMAMGRQFFWIDLPNGQPFLVRMDSSVIAGGQMLPTTGKVGIVGRITPKDAALLARWRETGILESDDHKMQAEFGSSYIEARRVQPAAN